MRMNFPQTWCPQVSRRQAHAFTIAQAITSGLTARQVSYRLKVGTLRRVAGVALRHRESPVTPQMLVHAAHLTWPDTVVCGPSVAALFGAPVNLFDAHVISQFRRKPLLHLIPHQFELAPWERSMWEGVPISSPTRSLIDALVIMPEAAAHSLFVWAFTRNRLTVADLENHLGRYPGRWGNNRLRKFMRNAMDGVMSPAEELAHKILHRAGITGWQADATIRDQSRILARADILFAAQRVVVEIDGKRFHGADRFQADRSRDNLLIGAGYKVLRFTWEDLTQRQHLVVQQIRQVLP